MKERRIVVTGYCIRLSFIRKACGHTDRVSENHYVEEEQ